MVRIKTKTIAANKYYYLEHSYREKGRVKKKELYLGQSIPTNIEKIKQDFFYNIYKEKWFNAFDKIKIQFNREEKRLPQSIKDKEIESFMISFTYSTNRIEGSKLSFIDTANLLEKGITPKAKPLSDIKEAENHKKAFYTMLNQKKDISLELILYWHKVMFGDTKPDMAGRLREYRVMILGSEHAPPEPEEVFPMISNLLRWYSSNKKKLHPVELAAIFHFRFESIHPFGDGNGRTGRLLMNFILHRTHFPMLNIKYTNRKGYYVALEKANVKKDENIFAQWFFRRYMKENKQYLKLT